MLETLCEMEQNKELDISVFSSSNMAVAAFVARTTAQKAYDLAHWYAKAWSFGDANQRLLEAALIKAKEKWTDLETAQLNYMNKTTFADEQEINSWLDKETAHDDWVELIEAEIQNLSLVDAPPTTPILSQSQKLERLTVDIKNKQNSLVSMVNRVQTSLRDNTIRFTKPMLENYTRECDNVMIKLNGELTTLHL